MELYGTYRNHLPRIPLTLPERSGDELEIEFVLDTGFDGYLTLPPEIAREIAIRPIGPQTQMTADGRLVECPVGYIDVV
jgi:predicted aspartyl protease